MKWVKKLIYFLRKFMTKFGFGSKNKPYARVVIEIDPITKEQIGQPYYIIFNSKGETLNSPVFFTLEEAENWIDEYLIEQSKDINPE